MLEYNKFNNKIDMWSLGCIIYEMVTKLFFLEEKKLINYIEIIYF